MTNSKMSSLFDSPNTTNIVEFSVSEISGALKRAVEDQFGHIRVRGEISGYRGPHSSGHAYFSLKDDKARLEAVIWRGSMSKLKFRPEEGMEVIATGKLTTYPGSSKYQIVIEQMEPAGAGALMALLEERKKRLNAEGLFDPARKQLLPFMPRIIGVITSPTGAVIRDIIHRISDRFPLHVLVWPVRVQGETSGAEVAAAINGFNNLTPDGEIPRPELLIVARGGGSLEDLWGFNDEVVVRAAANSNIPLISAVGHETDWTLIDLAADKRAPTPTGAAEMAVPVKADLVATIASLEARLKASSTRNLDQRRQQLRAIERALPSVDQLFALPRRRFDEAASRLGRALFVNAQKKRVQLDGRARQLSPYILTRKITEHRRTMLNLSDRLPRQMLTHLKTKNTLLAHNSSRLSPDVIVNKLSLGTKAVIEFNRRRDQAISLIFERQRRRSQELERLMRTLSHTSVLERGYAIVLDNNGAPVKEAAQLSGGEAVSLRFKDGDIGAVINENNSGNPIKPAQKKTPKTNTRKKETSAQGTLF